MFLIDIKGKYDSFINNATNNSINHMFEFSYSSLLTGPFDTLVIIIFKLFMGNKIA